MSGSKNLPPMPTTPLQGSRWKHFKGTEYTVVRVARDCEDPGRFLVVYEDTSGEVWIRERTNFLGNHQNGQKRFEECTCKAIQEWMDFLWNPSPKEPHHPDCPTTNIR